MSGTGRRLVVLLAYAGLVSIPDAYYQAARIDGASRWSVFRYIQLPKMKRVLPIAVLLRFMDCFMIYTEPSCRRAAAPALHDLPVDRSREDGASASSTSARRPRCRSSTS